jgi:hypothetical protein
MGNKTYTTRDVGALLGTSVRLILRVVHGNTLAGIEIGRDGSLVWSVEGIQSVSQVLRGRNADFELGRMENHG